MALRRVGIPSPNYSSRSGSTARLIVVHTAEGARTYEDLGRYFQGNVDASSHVGIDDSPAEIGVYVQRPDKAWTQAGANPVSVSAELCAFASWSASEWAAHQTMLDNCARWIAEEAAAFGIPITRLSASQAQGSGRGVCQHADLGSWGGGHWDCGSGLPLDDILEAARTGGPAAAEPTEPWYFLQDVGAARQVGQRMYYGGWSTIEARDQAYADLKKSLGHELRRFKDPDFPGAFLIDNSAYVTEIYGGWALESSRDEARATLEERLDRTLRPFREERNAEQGGVPWNCKNLANPF